MLDLSMPRMGGKETLSQLRALAPSIPVLMMSGYDEQQSMTRLSPRERTGFVQKPYTVEELTEHLRRILQTRTEH